MAIDFSRPQKIIIEAVDNTKRVIAGIQSRLVGLGQGGSSFPSAGKTGKESGDAIAWGWAKAQLAIGATQQAVQALTGSMQSAIKAQTSFITTASGLGNALGVPMDKSKALLETLQKDMSIAAASMPGENRDYLAVLNHISDTVAGEFRGDVEGFQSAVKDITIRAAALGSTIPGLTGDATGTTVEQLISGGAGWGQLKRYDFIQKQPQLRGAIEDSAREEGVNLAKWQKITTKQRIAIVSKALSKVATDSLFKEFEGTADSLIAGMKSRLFDDLSGVFGLRKTIKTRENRSALDAFTEVLKRINNLAAAGNRLAQRVGFVLDPMEALIDFFDGVNNFLGQITYIADTSLPGLEFNNIAAYIGEWVSGLASQAVSGLLSLDTSWLANLQSILGDFLSNVNWYTVGEVVGVTLYKLVIAGVRAIPGAIMNFSRITNALGGIGIGLVLGIVKGIANSLYNLFIKPMEDFLKTVRRWIDRLFGLLPQVPKTAPQIVNTATNLVSAVTNPVGFIGQKVGEMLTGSKKPTPTPGNLNADKVNSDNKVKPVAPAKTVSSNTSSSTTTTNTIQSLTISANSQADAQGIANVVIEELNARLGFRMAQQLA